MIASVDPYELLLLVVGAVAILSAVMGALLTDKPLSLPILLVGFGAAAFAVLPLTPPNPPARLEFTERLTELAILVSLTGAGLAIDRPIGWRSWSSTWRLLAIAMPVGIAATAVLGTVGLGLPLASALLLGSVLAPTDPVLADEVKVGEPADESDPAGDADDEVRVTLTSEAGLNDALAFPFVYVAIALAGGAEPASELWRWILVDGVFRIGVGTATGVVIGWLVQRLMFDPPRQLVKLADLSQGFVAVGMMFLAYGAAEVLNGYGFLAVFAAAVTVRRAERQHEYHRVLHGFVEQLEHILVVIVLVLFGGSLVGGTLDGLTVASVAVAIVLVLAVRPISGLLALAGGATKGRERLTIAVFGIRGLGSLYYLAYALSSAEFDGADVLWSTVAATLLVSMIVHGVAATPVLANLDRRRMRQTRWRTQRS